jgi:hypothetical protein
MQHEASMNQSSLPNAVSMFKEVCNERYAKGSYADTPKNCLQCWDLLEKMFERQHHSRNPMDVNAADKWREQYLQSPQGLQGQLVGGVLNSLQQHYKEWLKGKVAQKGLGLQNLVDAYVGELQQKGNLPKGAEWNNCQVQCTMHYTLYTMHYTPCTVLMDNHCQWPKVYFLLRCGGVTECRTYLDETIAHGGGPPEEQRYEYSV